MSWIRFAQGRPRFTGRLPPPPSLDAWADGDGRTIVDALASTRTFAFLGRRRAAKKALWAELRAFAEGADGAAAIDRVADEYVRVIGDLAVEQPALPRTAALLRRIVVVPRVICNSVAFGAITAPLDERLDRAGLQGGPALREYFFAELLRSLDAALVGSAPSLRRPVRSTPGWAIVGVDVEFSWFVPLRRTAEWRGHYILYEPPPAPMPRAARKTTESAIAALMASLPALTRLQRAEIVNQAGRALALRAAVSG